MSADHLALDLAVTLRHDGHGGVADALATSAGLTRWVREHAAALAEYGFDAATGHGRPPGEDGTPRRLGAAPARAGGPSVDAPTAEPPVAGQLGTGHGELAAASRPAGALPVAGPAEARQPGAGRREFGADPATLAAVLDVRAAVRALFARAVAPGPASTADTGRLPDAGTALERLNAASARVPVAPRLSWPAGGGPAAGYAVPGDAALGDRLAAALARAAIAFLAGPDVVRLRACPAPRCVLYFVQAHARQEWCTPSCGNRARVARHHARRRDAAGAVAGPERKRSSGHPGRDA